MKLGYIPTPSIEWIPQGDTPHMVYKKDKSNGFRIGKFSFGDMKQQPAWYCHSCELLIINCKE